MEQTLLFSVVNDLLSILCLSLVLLDASDTGELLTEWFLGSKGEGGIYLQPTTCLYSFYLKHRSRFVSPLHSKVLRKKIHTFQIHLHILSICNTDNTNILFQRWRRSSINNAQMTAVLKLLEHYFIETNRILLTWSVTLYQSLKYSCAFRYNTLLFQNTRKTFR